MKVAIPLLVGILTVILSAPLLAAHSASWVLVEYENDGLPIIMKVLEDLPPEATRDRFTWLTVISWRYDRTKNSGMPVSALNSQMVDLEAAIDGIEENGMCVAVYSKTGNGLKELAYYIADRDEFMRAFNEALSDQPRYPLEIEFFEDPEWSDMQTVHRVYVQ